MKRIALLHIVDDDVAVRDALGWLLRSHDISSVLWGSAEEFLDHMSAPQSGECLCLVLDIRMPGMSGIELFDRLRKSGWMMPVIFLTGHGDVPLAVQAIKDGAFDFMEKPVEEDTFVTQVRHAIEVGTQRNLATQRRGHVAQAMEQLTAREREVMQCILAGKLNKVIADELGIAMRTVEVHR